MELLFLPYSLEHGRSLLHLLIAELRSDKWTSFQVAVAFAKQSANEYPDLLDALKDFAAAGNDVQITFGGDAFGSTTRGSERVAVETLVRLLDAYPSAKIHLYHEQGRTFHPKIYLFSNIKKKQALLVIGSSNWGEAAFTHNVEANAVIQFNLALEDDRHHFDELQFFFESQWREDPAHPEKSFAREIRLGNLADFAPLLGSSTANQQRTTSTENDADEQVAILDTQYEDAENLFNGTKKNYLLSLRRNRPTTNQPIQPMTSNVVSAKDLPQQTSLLWQKKLTASDTQSQSGHPTGGVRLTQARWKIDDKLIDQARYFRENIFGRLSWQGYRLNPFVERASVKIHVYFPGEDLGIQTLSVSHKPSGEAGQGNYTTILHWSDLGTKVQSANLADKVLSLYRTTEVGVFVLRVE